MSGAVFLIVWLLGTQTESLPVIRAHYCSTPPVIDGVLEPAWQEADSATGFIQQIPENGRPASEPTTVYLLQDRHNLYIAFRCPVSDFSQVHDRLSDEPDGVRVLIDPFDDNVNAYCFIVGFNGVESDYRITGDGTAYENWDGVWRSAVRRHDWGYGIELAIPFRSLRYPPARTEWGIDFARYLVRRGERSFWSRHEVTGFRVSRMGRLTGIQPAGRGLGLELYPVGLVRHEQLVLSHAVGSDALGAEAGLDLAWAPTPSGNLQFTLLPDFAQIEADPYQVNLSRYELWLAERRPFFVEAVETFGGSAQPVKIFYSRRIGRPLPDGQVVPILAGLKWTDRLGRGQYGLLGALTGELADEPQSFYSVLAARHQILANSELGLLYAGKDNRQFSNHGLALDGIWRYRSLTSRLFLCGAQYGDSLDYAFSLDGSYQSDRLSGELIVRQIQPGFNMNGPGYTTWRGQYGTFYLGPVVYNRGILRYGALQPGVELNREWDYPAQTFDRRIFVNLSAQTLAQHSLTIWTGCGDQWALEHRFSAGYAGIYYASDYTRPFAVSLYSNYETRSANYRRLMIAPVAQLELTLQGRLSDRLSVWYTHSATVEADSLGRVSRQDLTSVLRPGLEYSLSPKASVRLSLETVTAYEPETARQSFRHSLFGLYSWTFAPRSTFYFATNWGFDRGDISAIFVAKVRYLFNI
ncbi:MAG: carbohydrate binding family 9 domain-containing protein [candidate division WOR-3 bacterium]|nr:carbohydrate binding family 9 domain-containing protein [candidate division WOR-3 bacterium]